MVTNIFWGTTNRLGSSDNFGVVDRNCRTDGETVETMEKFGLVDSAVPNVGQLCELVKLFGVAVKLV